MKLASVYCALFDKGAQPNHLDDALEAIDRALEEYRKAKADFYIEQAGCLREQILGMKGKLWRHRAFAATLQRMVPSSRGSTRRGLELGGDPAGNPSCARCSPAWSSRDSLHRIQALTLRARPPSYKDVGEAFESSAALP